MIRTTYKPRTIHRDAYGHGDTLGMMLRVNGRDLLDRHTAAAFARAEAEKPKRKTIDRYALLSDPATRTAYREFKARQRAARKAVTS